MSMPNKTYIDEILHGTNWHFLLRERRTVMDDWDHYIGRAIKNSKKFKILAFNNLRNYIN